MSLDEPISIGRRAVLVLLVVLTAVGCDATALYAIFATGMGMGAWSERQQVVLPIATQASFWSMLLASPAAALVAFVGARRGLDGRWFALAFALAVLPLAIFGLACCVA